MRLFWALVKLSFQRQLAYRAANLAGLATNLFFGLLRAAVMAALYGSRPEVLGISLTAAITYTGLSQGLIAFLSLFSWYEVMDTIHSGQIGSDLLKPMGYFNFWLARDLGRAGANLLLRGLTLIALYALIFDLAWPRGRLQWLSLALTMLLALLVSFAWRFLVNLAAFWTPNALGLGRFFFILSWILSGFLMPLRFFPDWFVRICYLTPFPHTVNTVVEVYLGLLQGTELLRALLWQGLWLLGLLLLGQVVLRAGVRRLVIQGG
ncbi:MAG: ABC-2 family transporter protein [Chloroflexia bacterium]|nr:ABC-2 family transporter protein [Chloroflexia bacterium]